MENNHSAFLLQSLAQEETKDSDSGFHFGPELLLFILLWVLFAATVAYIIYTKHPYSL
jgi:hypothetical protein